MLNFTGLYCGVLNPTKAAGGVWWIWYTWLHALLTGLYCGVLNPSKSGKTRRTILGSLGFNRRPLFTHHWMPVGHLMNKHMQRFVYVTRIACLGIFLCHMVAMWCVMSAGHRLGIDWVPFMNGNVLWVIPWLLTLHFWGIGPTLNAIISLLIYFTL